LHMSTANAAQQARGKLVVAVGGSEVAGSQIGTNSTTTGADTERFRSPPLTLLAGPNEYKIQAGGEVGGTYNIRRAAVIAKGA
jgi:hypothetical protein